MYVQVSRCRVGASRDVQIEQSYFEDPVVARGVVDEIVGRGMTDEEGWTYFIVVCPQSPGDAGRRLVDRFIYDAAFERYVDVLAERARLAT